jgi:hypothetical protein
MGIDQVVDRGASKNLALLVFRVPDFIFWLKEGVLSMSYMLFFATPSSRPPTHWVFRCALWLFFKGWNSNRFGLYHVPSNLSVS